MGHLYKCNFLKTAVFYLLEQGYTFVGDEQVARIFYCAQVPYTGYERQVINVVKLFSDAQADLKPLTFDFLAWYYALQIWMHMIYEYRKSSSSEYLPIKIL